MSQQFDFDRALSALQNVQDLTGKDGILTPLIKQLTEAALKAELETHLDRDVPLSAPASRQANRKNGYGTKTIKALSGSFDLETPRDRTGRHVTENPNLVVRPADVLILAAEQA